MKTWGSKSIIRPENILRMLWYKKAVHNYLLNCYTFPFIDQDNEDDNVRILLQHKSDFIKFSRFTLVG